MFEIDKRTDLLCTLLKCGKADLVLLDDIEYDFDEILYGCDSLDILNLNSLMGAVFSVGISQIEGILEDQSEYLRVSCSDDDKKIYNFSLNSTAFRKIVFCPVSSLDIKIFTSPVLTFSFSRIPKASAPSSSPVYI